MKIGFTGTRKGMTDKQKEVVKYILGEHNVGGQKFATAEEFHHGDCNGADAEAHAIAAELTIPVTIHPPIEKKERAFCQGAHTVLRPRPYIERNREIVDAVDMMIATPKEFDEITRSGTWATIRYARLKGVDIGIVYPDGVIELQ